MNGTGVRVKLCGLRTLADARAARDAGADMLGFVLAQSKRQLAPEAVAEIVSGLAADPAPHGRTVGVLGAGHLGRLAEQASAAEVEVVQLAVDATAERCSWLAAELGRPVLGVLHVEARSPVRAALEELLEVCELVILDAPSLAGGGSGATFDHRLLVDLDRSRLGVAGGLDPENVAQLVRQYGPAWVDVSSGIETEGRKDSARMRAFVTAARSGSTSSEGVTRHG